MSRLPVLFFGHGSPMLALEKSELTAGLNQIGKEVLEKFERPKAILMISAHWYQRSTYVQSAENPEQIFDMSGFPEELYQVKYPVKGFPTLSARVQEILGDKVTVNDEWGIDHGTWTVFVHAFPEAEIPVVQLSVNRMLTEEECYEIGRELAVLREEGYLITANGNIVHNLRRVQWNNPGGTEEAYAFNEKIISLVEHRTEDNNLEKLIHYKELENWKYAVPTPDHYLPLLYILGAAGDDSVRVFNNECNLGSMAMTSFAFGMEDRLE